MLAGIARGRCPSCASSWTIDDGRRVSARLADARSPTAHGQDRAELTRRRAAMTPGTLATIIYTSGTTGRPKGCELTHGNFLAEVFSAIDFLPELFEDEDGGDAAVPAAGARVRPDDPGRRPARRGAHRAQRHRADRQGPADVPADLRPRGAAGVRADLRHRAAQGRRRRQGARCSRWRRTRRSPTARRWSSGGPGLLLRARRALFDRLVYGKVKAAFGGQLRWAVSGGAPLGARLGHFFRGVGVTVLEGYGLTETTAATTVNTRAGTRIGTVGRPFPGFEVRIADDGVIQVRGGHVFSRLLAQPGGHRRGAGRGRLVRHRRPRLVRRTAT